MQLFRARLELEGPLASPLASGMIFGQLCWMLREREGEVALEAWLAEPERLWGVSDAFPAEHLPRPLLAPRSDAASGWDAERKALRGRALITRAGFQKARGALRIEHLNKDTLRASADQLHRTARNSIDRHTGRARDEGGLFFRPEFWPRAETERDAGHGLAAGFDRDLYIEAPAEDLPRIGDLLAHLGRTGFGKAASLGRGRFKLLKVAPDPELANLPGANRRLSLSRGVLGANMRDALWRLEPHFGKTGPQLALGAGASPFKRPLLLTKPGATFSPAGEGRFGAWLKEVHPTRPEIGHNAFHVAIPFVEASHA
jgi:CRISPR-associated protein Csm4